MFFMANLCIISYFCYYLLNNIHNMKLSIIGGGNMGGAIALGLATGSIFKPEEITVINRRQEKCDELTSQCKRLNTVVNDYSSLKDADIVVIAVKPWLVEDMLKQNKEYLKKDGQIIVSVAALVSLSDLSSWTSSSTPVFRVVPNTAISLKESMTFISYANASNEQVKCVEQFFAELGKVQIVAEKQIPAVTSLGSCGIAFAFRYIRAAMEGGVEMGIYAHESRDIVVQTLKGAVALLETYKTHPEQEIDKVTTPGGITIKGLNEMEHAGFSSAVIKGLKASNVK